jgi:hypothetical protein
VSRAGAGPNSLGVSDVGHAIGTALQMLGLLVMGYGIWRTCEAFAPPGRGMFDDYADAAQNRAHQLWAATDRTVRRLLRRPQYRTIAVGAFEQVGMTMKARVRIGFGPLDTSHTRTALRELERRIGNVNDRLANLDDRTDDERDADRKALVELTSRVDGAIAQLEAMDQRVALDGLRPQMVGLFLSVLGVAIATVW